MTVPQFCALFCVAMLIHNCVGEDTVQGLPENKKLDNIKDCLKSIEKPIKLTSDDIMLNGKLYENDKANKICVSKYANLTSFSGSKLKLYNDGRLIIGDNGSLNLHGKLTVYRYLIIYGQLSIANGANIGIQTGPTANRGFVQGQLIFGENSFSWCSGQLEIYKGGILKIGANSRLEMYSTATIRISNAGYGDSSIAFNNPAVMKQGTVDVNNGRLELGSRANLEVQNGGLLKIEHGALELWSSTEATVGGTIEIRNSSVKVMDGHIRVHGRSKLIFTADQRGMDCTIVLLPDSCLLIPVTDAQVLDNEITVPTGVYCRIKDNKYWPEGRLPITLGNTTSNDVFACYGSENELMASV